MDFISKELEGMLTLARWVSKKKRHYVSPESKGMRETRLAWIDDMIRRFKL